MKHTALACALVGAVGAAHARPPADGSRAIDSEGAATEGAATEGMPSDPIESSAPAADAIAPPAQTGMTDEQRTLHARGEAAARAGDWPAAARYFRAAVALGGFNLGWLSLGEALARAGRCAEAAAAFDAVATAPEIPEAPARFADAMAHAQRQALGRTCPGRLVVDCAAPMRRYRIGAGEERACGEPIELPPGRYRLRAGPAEMSVAVDAWVVGVETTRVTLALPPPLPVEAVLGPAPAAVEQPIDAWTLGGWAAIGLGGAGALAGAALHAQTLDAWIEGEEAASALADGALSRSEAQAAQDRHETLRQATIGVYVGAAVLAVSGLVVLLVDPAAGPSAPPGSRLSAGPGGLMGSF